MFSRSGFSDSQLFSDLRRLEQEFDDLMGGNTPWSGGIRSLPPGTFPAINVGSTDDQVSVYVFAPGVEPKALDIELQQNVLSVKGKRDVAVEKGATYYRHERFSGEFHRVLTLPDDIDPDKVEATYRDGILQISVRRRESAKPRQIEVQ
jgi:HSP20 family protein